jgi:hypothetical protein
MTPPNSACVFTPPACDGKRRLIDLELSVIRLDAITQGSFTSTVAVVAEYAYLMSKGVVFPPVRVWFDGQNNWLSDGYRRVNATWRLGAAHIRAEVLRGSLSDATWDSCCFQGLYGTRSREELFCVASRALSHPTSVNMSNCALARYIGVPETTLRRWRNRLAHGSNNDSSRRLVCRNGTHYFMNVAGIGKAGAQPDLSGAPKYKTVRQMENTLLTMSGVATPVVHTLLDVFSNWASGSVSDEDCLVAFHRIGDTRLSPNEPIWERPSDERR